MDELEAAFELASILLRILLVGQEVLRLLQDSDAVGLVLVQPFGSAVLLKLPSFDRVCPREQAPVVRRLRLGDGAHVVRLVHIGEDRGDNV